MPTATPKAERRPRATFPSLQWWIRDKDGEVVLAQAPNAALSVWLVAVVTGFAGLFDGERSRTVTRLGQGALIAWALDEVIRGASPARRVLGAVVLGGLLTRLFG